MAKGAIRLGVEEKKFVATPENAGTGTLGPKHRTS